MRKQEKLDQGLADLAANLEKAGKDGDEEVIYRDHDRALEMYDKLASLIREYVEMGKDTEKDEKGHTVLEFSPQ